MRAMVWGAVLALALSGGAQGETVTRDYRAVMHVTHAETIEVLDNPDHVVGIAKFSGLALFDGEPMLHRYDGWFDTVKGIGDFRGTAVFELPDGTLTAHYRGQLDELSPDDFEFQAEFYEFSGTGAYLSVRGEGGFSGRRMEEVSLGGTTFVDGTITLDLEP